MRVTILLAAWVLLVSSDARAGETIVNPYAPTRQPVYVDFSQPRPPPRPDGGIAFEDLDDHIGPPVERERAASLPPGWVQQGSVVIPQAVADGADVRSPTHRDLTQAPHPSAADPVPGPDASELCLFPDETPAGIYPGSFVRGSEYPRHGTVYMNFVGALMTAGSDNAAENRSLLAFNNYDYPAYGGGEEKAIAVAQAVQADYKDVAVRVVYLQRPPKMLPYVMVMMGGHYSDTTAGPSGGVAPGADCEDAGMRNVCYAFVNLQATTSQANVASQELGHTMGLGHTYGNDRVMAFGYDTNSLIDMGFGDECTEVLIAQGQSGYCAGVNKCHCGGDGKLQHDVRTLQAVYAPPGPDMIPPTIMITTPPDGAHFESGETVSIGLAPEDDFGGYGWQVAIVNADTDEMLAELVDYEAAQAYDIAGLKDGRYRLVAQIQDHADQVGEHTITITIGEVASGETGTTPTTSEGEESGEAGGSSETGGSGEESGGSGSSGATAPEDEVDDGCNCRHDAPAEGGLTLAALGLLALGRRRRA